MFSVGIDVCINRLVADSREVNRVAQTGWRYSRRDDDLSRHFRMDRAEIFDRACRRKRLRKLIIGIEGAGVELSILIRHQMRDVISIDPGYRGTGFDRQGWRVEGEVGDLYSRVVGQCPAAACNQAQPKNCYKTSPGKHQSANLACSGRARGKRV